MPTFDKDSANTRRVLGTDNTGVELDGQVRGTVWDVGTTAWVRQIASIPSGGTINITGTVNTVGGSGQATVNINGFPTVNLGSWPTLNVGNQIIVTGTVNTVGGGGQATVNINGFPTVNIGSAPTFNVGNQVIVTGTVNTVGGGGQATVNINGSVVLTATVNLGSIGTINVGNTVTVSGNVTATTTIASAPTMNVGNSVNLGTVPTVNVGNTVNVLGTATVNFGSIGTVAVGNQVVTNIAQVGSTNIGAFPAGFQRTTDEPRQVFYDPFDGGTVDVTNRWTSTAAGGGVAAAQSAGNLTLGTGTTISGYSHLVSQPTFVLPIPGWLGVSEAIKIESPVTANTYRFWGQGTAPASPTAALPLTDAVGFELATDGKLYAVIYAAGTRTVIQDLSSSGNNKQPTDANFHRYITYIRTDIAYWYIDGLGSSQLVASSSFQSPQVQTLPVRLMAIAGASAPLSSGVLTCAGIAAWDTAKNATQISDGTLPWRKLAVTAAGAINILGTATVNLGSIATVSVGFPTVNVGSSATLNVGNTVNVLGTATVNLGSIGTINVGNTHGVTGNVTATVNLGTAIPSGPNVVGQWAGRAAITNPTAVADAAAVQYMLDKLGRTIVSRAPQDLIESISLKHNIGTVMASMTVSLAGPITMTLRDGAFGSAAVLQWVFTGSGQNMTPVDFDPVFANTTASAALTADLSASVNGIRLVVTGFKSP